MVPERPPVINWSIDGGVYGINEANGETVDAAGLAELIGSSDSDPLSFQQLLKVVGGSNMSQLSDRLVACVAWVESGGNPTAQNPNSSALGLMQMTTGTISSYVLPWYSDNPSFAGFTPQSLYTQQVNPAISIMTGSAYLQMLAFDRWSFGIPGALARYHYGPNSSNRARPYTRKIMRCAR